MPAHQVSPNQRAMALVLPSNGVERGNGNGLGNRRFHPLEAGAILSLYWSLSAAASLRKAYPKTVSEKGIAPAGFRTGAKIFPLGEDARLAQSGELERRTVYYTGRVQGVGFRYETRFLAQPFEVTGYVQNLDD